MNPKKACFMVPLLVALTATASAQPERLPPRPASPAPSTTLGAETLTGLAPLPQACRRPLLGGEERYILRDPHGDRGRPVPPPPPRPLLVITDARIEGTECDQPLAFEVVMCNVGSADSTSGWLTIQSSDPRESESPQPGDSSRRRFRALAARTMQALVLSTPELAADCTARRCYVLSVNTDDERGRPHPAWDGPGIRLCTRAGIVSEVMATLSTPNE